MEMSTASASMNVPNNSAASAFGFMSSPGLS
jgi:hypothetical protein